ncbi:MAG: pilin [Candidatus Saccharibacteria bacterium]|nr:pilin [Candidatus Saccharibacteria bacterium]
MKKIKMLLVGAAVAVAGMFMAAPAMAAEVACPKGSLRGGEDGTGTAPTYAQCNLPEDKDNVNGGNLFQTIQTIINWILAVLGVVAVIMVIIGGFTYMTSQGDPGKTKKARDTILYGIIGLVIALLAFAIVNFVLANIFAS